MARRADTIITLVVGLLESGLGLESADLSPFLLDLDLDLGRFVT